MRCSRVRRLAALLLAAFAASCDPTSPEEIALRRQPITAAVEQWRKLTEKYFKYQHVTWALNIIQCESGGDPDAYNSSSGASGLFQHLKQYWAARATAAGFPGASPFNAEANIAASAYLLYASGGGPQHWSCKFSPYENFNYVPQFFKNGVPVPLTCTPSCNGSKITAADCGVGDCAAFGATCVDDSLGVRCVSVFCPAQGQKKVCVSGTQLGSCKDGGITTVACGAGETCVAASGSASCQKPAPPPPDSGPPPTAPDAGVSPPPPAPDLGPGPEPSTDAGWFTDLPPALNASEGSQELHGACQLGEGAPSAPPPLLLLLLALALARRRGRIAG